MSPGGSGISGRGRWDAILFDLDGTLADTIELILASYRHTMRTHLGQALPDARWLSTIGRPLHDQLREFSRDELEAEAMLATYVTYQREIHDAMTRAYPGVVAVLDALKVRGTSLAVVTSKRSAIAARTLACCEIDGHFDAVVCADHVERGKPDPEPVHRALELLGAVPERVLFVGDSPYDMLAGNGGGVRTAAALWGPYEEEDLRHARPDFWVREVQDVLDLEP